MKKLTIISFIFLLISCGPLAFTTAEYGLKDRSTDKIELPRGKYLFLINNDPTSDTEFSQKITGDFRGILGTNLSNVFKNDYFDNRKFLNKKQIDSTLLNNIHKDTGMDFLILLRFGTLEKNIEHNKIIKIEEAKNIMRVREYHVILNIYDLKTQKELFYNEAVSLLKRDKNSGWTPTQISQLKQTYHILFKNLKKRVILT